MSKKKGKKGGKKGKKKEGDELELTLEEKFKRTAQEVDYLKEQLAERQEFARRSKATEMVMRDRLEQTKTLYENEQANKKDLSFDLTRQYKTLQLQSEAKIHELETIVKRLTGELTSTQEQLKMVTKERDKLREEKEVEVTALNNQLTFLKKSYETIIQDALDSLSTQLEGNREQWNRESQTIDDELHQLLLKFGTSDIQNSKT
jgi:hypothetical protein